MECQSSDSKKLFKVFDGSKRKKSKKKESLDDTNSIATDDSNSACQPNLCRQASSVKANLKNVSTSQTIAVGKEEHVKRDRSSPSLSPSPIEVHRKRSSTDAHRPSRSPRRHRRPTRDGMSLALKAGLVSTPRSISPRQETECTIETLPQDQDSFIYAFLEEAIKKDKKSKRHSRRHEEYRGSRERDRSSSRRHRHHHRRRCDEVPSRDHDQLPKDVMPTPVIDQTALFETFAKICSQLNEKPKQYVNEVAHTQSHKSLQCEVVNKRDSFDVDQRPVRLQNHEHSRDNVSRIRSQEHFGDRVCSRDKMLVNHRLETIEKHDKYACCPPYDNVPRYTSKFDVTASRMHNVEDRYRDYPPNVVATRTCINHEYRHAPAHDHREYRDYDREPKRHYNDEKRQYEQQTSRSYDVNRDVYPDDDKYCRRTARSDAKEKRYNDYRDRRYDERDKYFEERRPEPRDPYLTTKERRRRNLERFERTSTRNLERFERTSTRNLERFERTSTASREDDFRDRCSDRERDSGLSVADGENSTVSGRSNYLRVVKQEISEQREAMDKMMKLWKELMRCFKGISSQTQGQDKAVNETAANVRDSAAAQLRLWRECMRRYETVARDVGDTDARLMEEITKQRSEMSEMAGMWQECLQRYREISTDFNSLKQKLVTPESPTRLPAAPLVCAEGEGNVPAAPPYRLPPNYPPMPQMTEGMYGMRPHVSAPSPPAWWWRAEEARHSRHASRRRSSPESRGSRDRDRDRRHRHDDRHRDDGRYKEKSSKAGAARSEHRHRKR